MKSGNQPKAVQESNSSSDDAAKISRIVIKAYLIAISTKIAASENVERNNDALAVHLAENKQSFAGTDWATVLAVGQHQ